MRKARSDIIAISALCILVGIFFARLFYPELHLLVTPDYGRSDAWHFSFPTKYALSQALRAFSLPLWRNDIGSGFPLFAEGQTGALFIPNVVLFGILPPVPAYNLALVFAIAMLGVGMYGLCRVTKLSPIASWFTAVSVMFSGLSLTQLPHITLLQGMSMLPSIVTVSILTATSMKWRWAGVLAFFVSQQIYAGFPQATFITLMIAGLIVFWHATQHKHWQACFIWVVGVGLGIGAGAIQLLPSWEFLRAGTDPHGFTPTTAAMYSMPFTHLMSFINPFVFGNPHDGTYPPFYAFDGSIFWENTAYLGILPIILLIGSIALIPKHGVVRFWWILFLTSITLAAGKYGPAYVIFSVWPFTLFRVPSRFLWLALIAIAYIAGYVIDTVKKRQHRFPFTMNMLLASLLIGHTAQLMGTWWSYHLIVPARTWMNAPSSVRSIGAGRMYTIGESKLYNDTMTKTGWTTWDRFHSLRMGLSPNSNMIWNVSQYDVYAGRFLNRPTIMESLLSESIQTDVNRATVSGTRLLSLSSITHILSFLPLDTKDLDLTDTIREGDVQASVYTNPHALPRAYMTYEATSAATLAEAASILQNPQYTPGAVVLLEKHEVAKHPQFTRFLTSSPSKSSKQSSIQWLQNSHEYLSLQVQSETDGILVLCDTYYPGWLAHVDTVPVPILTANLSQRALLVPKGKHTITFRYAPASLRRGGIITGISLLFITFLMVVPIPSASSRIRKTTRVRASGHRNIRRRS